MKQMRYFFIVFDDCILNFFCLFILVIGLGTQSSEAIAVPTTTCTSSVPAAQAAAGLLGPITVQNLLTLAAMSHQPGLTSTGGLSTPQSPMASSPTSMICKL